MKNSVSDWILGFLRFFISYYCCFFPLISSIIFFSVSFILRESASVVFRRSCGDDPRFGLGTYRDSSRGNQSEAAWRRLPPSFPSPVLDFLSPGVSTPGLLPGAVPPPFLCFLVFPSLSLARSSNQSKTLPFPSPNPSLLHPPFLFLHPLLLSPPPPLLELNPSFTFPFIIIIIINHHHPIPSVLSISCHCFLIFLVRLSLFPLPPLHFPLPVVSPTFFPTPLLCPALSVVVLTQSTTATRSGTRTHTPPPLLSHSLTYYSHTHTPHYPRTHHRLTGGRSHIA